MPVQVFSCKSIFIAANVDDSLLYRHENSACSASYSNVDCETADEWLAEFDIVIG
jgi:hypothetical protein